MSWDMDSLRKIAGLNESVINEAKWDDDDEDRDVKAAMDEAKKRKIKLPKVKDIDPDKDVSALARSRKSKDKEDEDEKEEAHEKHEASESAEKEKAEHTDKKPSAESEKKETPAEEKKEEAVAKRRGKAPSETSNAGKLRAWVKNNPGKSRKEAWEYAQSIGMTSKNGFSTQYQAAKGKKVAECFVLRHPQISSFILSENRELNQYQWVSDSDIEGVPMVLEDEQTATELMTYLSDYKRLSCVIDCVNLED